MSPNPGKPEGGKRYTIGPAARNKVLQRELDQALAERDRARSLACRLEEELALIRRAAAARRHG